jgi:hypothetical protein
MASMSMLRTAAIVVTIRRAENDEWPDIPAGVILAGTDDTRAGAVSPDAITFSVGMTDGQRGDSPVRFTGQRRQSSGQLGRGLGVVPDQVPEWAAPLVDNARVLAWAQLQAREKGQEILRLLSEAITALDLAGAL